MRGITRLTVILAVVLAGSAAGQIGGRDLYIAKCAACHARDGSGDCTVGRSLKVADVRPSIKDASDGELAQIVRQGRGKMPANKKLDDDQLRSLTLFLRDLADGNPNAGRSAAQTETRPFANAREAFQEKCSVCHGRDGAGHTTIGKDERVPDLTSAAVQDRSAAELQRIIWTGAGAMPAYKNVLNPTQTLQLVSYMRGLRASTTTDRTAGTNTPSLNAPLVEATAPASASSKPPENGRALYAAKCSACHSRDGSGRGTIGRSMKIRSLTSLETQARSDETLAAVISNGAARMPGYGKKLHPEQIQLLVDYIRELATEL